jgi:hypothetical protein|tara:strand:- start:5381 stop:5833 length:453 start_codon:yes stop_codon:yes gene_type:complete
MMQPDDSSQPTIQDSVVGRDMHTGNVIHNHYHLPPSPQPIQPPPQTVIYSPQPPQPVQYQQHPPQVFVPYKKIYGTDWIIFGVISLVLGFVPGLNLCCGLVSGVGVISMLPHLHLSKNKQHPESSKVIPALVLNSIAIFIALFTSILVMS